MCEEKPKSTWKHSILGVALLSAGLVAAAPFSGKLAGDTDPSPPAAPPVAEAALADIEPVLDGDVLNDPAWEGAPVIRQFWQTTPNEGQPASEETSVYILYGSNTLYVGVVCFDRNPAGIIVSDSRRDSSLDETDSFLMVFDTYRDRQNGFVFGTNPAGIEYDGQVTKEGAGTGFGASRQAGGSGGGFNINWDASWEVRTQIGDYGWSAEFAIPFQSLRFREDEEQIWGVNFQRNIRRRNETSFWSPLPRQFNLFRLSMAGSLVNIRPGNQRHLRLIPYVLGELRHSADASRTNWLGDGGIDLKYSATPSLTLDGTYNTDFAQVEVDEQQINLDRFNLFFPEKRPFFLENAGFFAVGSPGEVELFFSRRIGIGPQGQVIPILGGARLSGKLGQHLNLGVLNMQTREVEGVSPANNFSVFRLSRDLPNRSTIGGIFVNREATGSGSDDSFNRTFGLDGKWGIGEYGEVSGFLAKSTTPGLSEDEHAFRFGSRYDSQSWLLEANYTEVGENFNPEVGFLQREGFRKVDGLVHHRYRPGNLLGLHELRPHVSYRGYWDFEGFQETGYLHMDNHWEWKSGAEIHTGVNLTREGVKEAFEIYPSVVVPAATYDHVEAQLVFFTNQGAWLSGRLDSRIGGFFGGDRVAIEPSARMRLGERFNSELALERNDISLPGGDFVVNLARARVSFSFSPRVLVQSLIQYNDRADIWSGNIRFAWLQSANTGLFVVYRDTRGLARSGYEGDRSLIVKFSRIIDLFN